jgi:4-hydroxybenzoate polyprenyltransferase
MVAVAALAAALGLAIAVSHEFFWMVVFYLTLTGAYSIELKEHIVLDVLTLSLLYTVRILAGSVAAGVSTSSWLLAFSAFIFFSLALVKRCAELAAAAGEPSRRLPGRGYERRDLAALQAFGIATGVVSVLVLAMFVDSTAAQLRYPHPERLWLACPAIWYWLGRVWLETARGAMHHDPVVFSLRDRPSWAAFATVAVVWAAALAPI